MKVLLLFAGLLHTVSVVNARSYSTTFPLTENPISEGGQWISGAALDGKNCDVQSGGHRAYGVGGRQCTVNGPPNYGNYKYADPVALLTGTWGPDQTVTAVAAYSNPNASYWQEIELHIRMKLGGRGLQGYEINFGVSHGYVQIVRWDGAPGKYAYLGSSCKYPVVCGQVNGYTIPNGATAKVMMYASTITAYVNGTLISSATDSTYANGAPGIGYDAGCDSTYANFAWSSFTATDNIPPTQRREGRNAKQPDRLAAPFLFQTSMSPRRTLRD